MPTPNKPASVEVKYAPAATATPFLTITMPPIIEPSESTDILSPTPSPSPSPSSTPTPSPTPTERPESVVSINLLGEPVMEIKRCSEWIDPGFVAQDSIDGNLAASTTISSDLDVNEVGCYTVTYTARNVVGDTAEVSRTVYVRYNKEDYEAFEAKGKVVYLTFDDGPSENTEKLLGILDKYNVKVTFFVKNSDQLDLVKKEAANGHTVAIHTYTHSYSKVYRSEEAYYDDLYKMREAVYEKIGLRSNLIRFPGGSSNTVSRSYNSGIMTRLAKSVQEKGFCYFDWNVSTTDGNASTRTSDVVRDHAIAGMKSKNIAVVLMHDTHSHTVNAVEEIINFGLENGYTFLPLSEYSFQPHHGISN